MDDEIKTGEMTGEIDESITVEEDFTALEGKAVSISDDSDNKTNEEEVYEEALEIKESLDDIRQQIKDKLLDILEKGKITDADGCEIELLNDQYTEKYNELKDVANTVIPGGKGTSTSTTNTSTTDTTEVVKVNIDYDEILNAINERADWLYIDEDGQVMLNGEVVPKLKVVELEAEKIKADVGEFKNLTTENFTATNAEITNLKSDYGEFKNLTTENFTATNANITNLQADYGEFKDLTANNFTATNGEITNLKSNKADIEYLQSNYATIQNLNTNIASINTALIDKANVSDLNATNAKVTNLQATKADITDLNATNGNITNLQSLVAQIQTLIGGNLTMDNIQSLILTSDKVTIADALIKNAMIDSVSANKINSGTINTNNVKIQSADGSMVINGTTQQFKDKNNKVRIQIGKDAQGNFTFALFSQDGVGVLIDETGIKSGAVPNGLIVNDMVSNNANISGSKLDINSVVSSINNGTTTIKGTKIQLDEQGQSLQVAFSQLKSKVETIENVTIEGDLSSVIEQVSTNTTSINTMQGQISSLISNTTITKANGEVVQLKDEYNSTKSTVNSHSTKIGSLETNLATANNNISSVSSKQTALEQNLNGFKQTVSQTYTTKADFNNLEIGGRNLLRKADLVINSHCTGSFDTSTNTWTLTATAGDTFQWGCGLNIINYNVVTPYGKTCMISFEIFSPRAIEVNWDINNYATNGSSWGGNDNDNTTNRKGSSKSIPANQWTKCWFSYTNSNGANTNKVDICDNSVFGVIMVNETSNLTFKIRNVKAELGTTPTAWTPAPEDIDSAISAVDNKFTNYSTTSQMNSAINQKANEITSTVSNTYATKTALNTVDGKFANYSTTSAMNTAINQKANEITSSVSSTYATKTALKSTDDKFANYSTTSQMNTAINQKANEITSSVSQTYATKSEFNGLSIGGRNYLSRTSVANTTTISSLNSNNYYIYDPYTTSGNKKLSEYGLVAGDKLTVSFDYKVTNVTTYGKIRAELLTGDNTTSTYIGGYETKDITSSSTSGRYVATLTLNNSTVTACKLRIRVDNGKFTLTISNVKMEKGDKPTAWTPAPEDIDSAISTVDNKFVNYSTTSQMNTAINQKANEITSSVSQTYATKTEFGNLRVGGTNLVKNSKLFGSVISNNGWTIANTGNEGYKKLTIETTSTGWMEIYIPLYSAINSIKDKITISFDYTETTSGLLGVNFAVFNGTTRVKELTNTQAKTLKVIGNPDGWKRVSWTIDPTSLLNQTNATQYGVQFKKWSDLTGTIQIKKVQVEIGTVASEWKPAPQDVDSAINTVDGKFASYSTTSQMNTAINQKAESITQSVSNTYATKTALNSANNNITSLTNRMSNAESKLTKDSLTTTIGSYYTTSNDVNGLITSKGYATTSQVTQTATDLTAKFTASGGYNLIENSSGYFGVNNWFHPGADRKLDDFGVNGHIDGYKNFTAHKSFYAINSATTEKYIFTKRFPLKPNTKYTLSGVLSADAKCSGIDVYMVTSESQTGASNEVYMRAVNFTTSTWWKKFTYTFTTGANVLSGCLRVDNNGSKTSGTNCYIYFGDLLLEEGSVAHPWSPHPNEVRSGITQIDATGIKVFHDSIDSNSYTHMTPSGFYIKNKSTDIFKVDTNGLYFKGKAEITSGSMPSSLLTGTIDNARLNSTIVNGATNGTSAKSTLDSKANGWDSAKSTVDNNKNNWSNAYNRVVQWASGSVTGNTTINGGLIQTGTITAKQLYLGDLTNYCNLREETASLYGFTSESSSWGTWYKLNNNQRDICISGNKVNDYGYYKCLGGESFRIKFEVKSNVKGSSTNGGSDSVYCGVNIGLYGKLGDGSNFYQIPSSGYTGDANSTEGHINVWTTLPSNARTFGVFLQLAGWGNWSGTCYIKNVQVFRMSSGELIVDGSVTANKISANAITADKIAGNAITGKTITGGVINGTVINGSSINSDSFIGDMLAIDGVISAKSLQVQDIDSAKYPGAVTADFKLYVSTSGNDDSEIENGATFRTFDALLDKLPKNLNGHEVRIEMSTNITENVDFKGFFGGKIRLYMKGHTLYGYVVSRMGSARINICSGYIGNASDTSNGWGKIHPSKGYAVSAYTTTVASVDQGAIGLYNIDVYGADNYLSGSTTKLGVAGQDWGTAYLNGVSYYGCDIGARANAGGRIHDVLSYNVCTKYGFYATTGGYITLAGSEHSGGKSKNYHEADAGKVIVASGATFASGQASVPGGSAPVVPTTKTITIKSTYGDTYRSSVYNNWKKDGTCRQGDYGYGDCNGVWFFGDAFSDVEGKTITKVEIKITRQSGGSSSAVGLVVKSHGHSSRPSGAPTYRTTAGTLSLATGASGTLPITNSTILSEISSGVVKGFGIQSTYNSSSYAVCSGSVTVKITYKE